jgi:hypothetical protein
MEAGPGVPAVMVVETDHWDRLITVSTMVVADMRQRRVYLAEIEQSRWRLWQCVIILFSAAFDWLASSGERMVPEVGVNVHWSIYTFTLMGLWVQYYF